MSALARWVNTRFHYGWVVVGVIFIVLLLSAGVRATPSVLILPLERAFGWDRATISGALSVSLFLYGFMGPFAAAAMESLGIRRTVLFALALLLISITGSSFIGTSWQLMATWGVLVGIGTGSIAMVLGAAVSARWFVERRGLVMGLFAASAAAGQLVFLPILAAISEAAGWQPVIYAVAIATAVAIPIVFWLLAERPSDVGLTAYGAKSGDVERKPNSANPIAVAFEALGRGVRSRDFWLLSGSFFVCGLSTNGLIGTHLIAACFDQGIPEVKAAGLLAMMGLFNTVGTTASGWLSDRWNNRWLLFWYYALRGVSLVFLPYSGFTFFGLSLFAVFYGLDWIATVPPTVRLTTESFGKQDGPILFGWIFCAHQIGSAVAAFGAGWMRTELDSYLQAFIIAGLACAAAAMMSLMVGRSSGAAMRPAVAAGAGD